MFVVLNEYPLGFLLSIVAIVSLCAFFITSANSGVYVLSMLSTDGDINPPNSKKILWGVIQSVMAVGLLMAGGLKLFRPYRWRRRSRSFSSCSEHVRHLSRQSAQKRL